MIEQATKKMLPTSSSQRRLPIKRNSASLEIATVYRNDEGEYVVNQGENIHFRLRAYMEPGYQWSPDGYPHEVVELKYKDINSLMADGWVID